MEEYTQLFSPEPEGKWQGGCHKLSEEKKLELKLGPPGDQFHGNMRTKRVLEYANIINGEEGEDAAANYNYNWFMNPNNEEEYPAPAPATATAAVPPLSNTSHKRVAVAPVVGWPPIRSSRKNLSSSSKPATKSPEKTQKEETIINPESSSRNDVFVKINVEGVPIGRKINVNAYNSYEKLSVAIDEHFSGLIAAQKKTSSGDRSKRCTEETIYADAGSVAGNGEYTLLYEDNEGDRMLVGDVPWHMFVSTVKRLRVLKSFELSTPRLPSCRSEHQKTPLNSSVAEDGN